MYIRSFDIKFLFDVVEGDKGREHGIKRAGGTRGNGKRDSQSGGNRKKLGKIFSTLCNICHNYLPLNRENSVMSYCREIANLIGYPLVF